MQQNHCSLAYFTLVSLSQDSSYWLEQHAVSGLAQRGVLDEVECGCQTFNLREVLEIVAICDYIFRRE